MGMVIMRIVFIFQECLQNILNNILDFAGELLATDDVNDGVIA